MREVGYLGPHGTFSEEAAYRYFGGDTVSWHPFPSIPDVLDGVLDGTVDIGVVPIENTIEGPINVTLDTLIHHQEFRIVGEIVLPVSLCLLAYTDKSATNIREVWSILPALAQCRRFLRDRNAITKPFDSTASAAAAVRDAQRPDVAAVASSWAAETFQLKIIASGIEDSPANFTRFLVISRGESAQDDPQKTTLVILPGNEHAGVLAGILNVFATLELNLTWIESRPTREKLGTYLFVLDVEAGIRDIRMERAIHVLKIYGHHARVLGSYQTRRMDDGSTCP